MVNIDKIYHVSHSYLSKVKIHGESVQGIYRGR